MNRLQLDRPSTLRRAGAYTFLTIVFLLFAIPIVYAVLTAFQPALVSSLAQPQWIFRPTLHNFVALFSEYSFTAPLLNSLQSSLGSALLSMIIATPAAYALSRSRSRRRDFIGIALLFARALPAIGLSVPAYAIFTKLHLTDTIAALLIVYLPYNLALATILMRVFFDGVPRELDEAAAIDGAGPIQTLWRVILPLSTPGLASVAILAFLFAWNNFLFPLVLTGSRSGTIPLALQQFLGSYTLQWNQVMAGVVLLSLPLLLLSVVFGRYMVRGLTSGSVK